jgi:hypothetical protein
MYQLIALVGTAFLWLMGQTLGCRILLALAIVIPLLLYLFFLIKRDIDKAAKRLRELESSINRRAGEKDLLVWETRCGGAVAGYYGLSKPLPTAETLPNDSDGSKRNRG